MPVDITLDEAGAVLSGSVAASVFAGTAVMAACGGVATFRGASLMAVAGAESVIAASFRGCSGCP